MSYRIITFLISVTLAEGVLFGSNKNHGTIRVAIENNIRSFDPRNNIDANSQYLEDLIHCSIISFNESGSIIPKLASKVPTWSTDGLKLTVKLNPKAKFYSGQRVTASDVAATYRSLLGSNKFSRRGAFTNVDSITVHDELSLTFKLKKPDGAFLTNLVIGIIPSQDLTSNKKISFKKNGCGAYYISSQDINTITLQENPNYTLGTRPKIKSIELKVVKSEKTRFAKLRTGEIDLVQNSINRKLINSLDRKYPNLKVAQAPALKTTYIGFNMKDKYTGNPRIREAISHAIDRKPIINHILSGMATPAQTLLPPSSEFFLKTLKKHTLNLAKANEILDLAGFKKKGRYRFTVSYKTTTDATRIGIAKAISSQLKKIGIKVSIQPMEWGRFKQDVEKGNVQMWGLTWIGFKDPDIYRYAFSSSSFPPNGGNRGHYQNKDLDKILSEAKETVDNKSRKNLYHKAQQIISIDRPYIFLWHEDNFAIMNNRIQGYKVYADGRFSSLIDASVQ